MTNKAHKRTYALLLVLALLTNTGLASELARQTAIKVQRAWALQQQEQLNEAIGLLNKLQPSRAYDRAFVARLLGVFYWQRGDIQLSITKLTTAIESKLLDDEQVWSTQRMLADLLLMEEAFKRALPHYQQLAASVPEGQRADQLWLRIAQCHYQLAQWKQVLDALKSYRTLVKPDTKPILTMKLGAELQLKHWENALSTAKLMIALEPETIIWWQQMAGLQMHLKRPADALSTLALAKRQGLLLPQQDLKTLAQLYTQQGVPERAAQIYAQLKNSQSDPELLATQAFYWQQAREWSKAIVVWEQAAELDNRHRWSLAQLLLQEREYQQALAELERVTITGKKQAEVELAKVRAHYKLKAYDKALHHARQADNLQSTASTRSWIKSLTRIQK